MNEITSVVEVALSRAGKACLMTSSTDTTTEPLEGQTELFDLDAELAELTDASVTDAADQVDAAELAARAARKEKRAMNAAWVSLFAGLLIALGSFASIAWHDSVSANGPTTSVESTTTAP